MMAVRKWGTPGAFFGETVLANRVVSFIDFQPIPRFDGIPWTHVKIEEGPASVGPWTQIADITFVPVDPDPANPLVRNFTTEMATLDAGWYKITFIDATGDSQQPVVPIYNDLETARSFTPTVSEVGALLRARTKDNLGNELGTFTGATRPTNSEALELINQAADDVLAGIDDDVPFGAQRYVRDAIRLQAAMRVELSYFPEMVGSNRSAYEQYQQMYEASMKNIEKAVQREQSEEEEQDEHGGGSILFSFPPPDDLWTRPM